MQTSFAAGFLFKLRNYYEHTNNHTSEDISIHSLACPFCNIIRFYFHHLYIVLISPPVQKVWRLPSTITQRNTVWQFLLRLNFDDINLTVQKSLQHVRPSLAFLWLRALAAKHPSCGNTIIYFDWIAHTFTSTTLVHTYL